MNKAKKRKLVRYIKERLVIASAPHVLLRIMGPYQTNYLNKLISRIDKPPVAEKTCKYCLDKLKELVPGLFVSITPGPDSCEYEGSYLHQPKEH